MASGMGESTFSPPRPLDDPAVAALVETFADNDGMAVVHDTIQYLVERSEHEEEWLDALPEASFPTTLIWGLYDTVAASGRYLHLGPITWQPNPPTTNSGSSPTRTTTSNTTSPPSSSRSSRGRCRGSLPQPGALSDAPRAPLFADRSRAGLPSAAEVLAQPASLETLEQDSKLVT